MGKGPVSLPKEANGVGNLPKQTASSRDPARGVWELARLHTREAWLCWYPAVWGACLAAGTRDVNLDVATFARILFGIWSSVTATHCAFCTFNDLCDRNLDINVERCKTRPLPAGMITPFEATLAFCAWLPIVLATTYSTLGEAGVLTFIPVWVLSTAYPFMKRFIQFPQVILGAVIGGAVFPGWVAVTGDLNDVLQAMPLFAATLSWVIYFDTIYATQDRADDEKIGVRSLAVLLGNQARPFLVFLGVLQVGFFAMTAFKANMSMMFWVFGLGVWTLNLPWHVLSLDAKNPKSGGKVFKANIMLGLYMTAIALVELLITRVYLRSLLHVGQRVIARGFA